MIPFIKVVAAANNLDTSSHVQVLIILRGIIKNPTFSLPCCVGLQIFTSPVLDSITVGLHLAVSFGVV